MRRAEVEQRLRRLRVALAERRALYGERRAEVLEAWARLAELEVRQPDVHQRPSLLAAGVRGEAHARGHRFLDSTFCLLVAGLGAGNVHIFDNVSLHI